MVCTIEPASIIGTQSVAPIRRWPDSKICSFGTVFPHCAGCISKRIIPRAREWYMFSKHAFLIISRLYHSSPGQPSEWKDQQISLSCWEFFFVQHCILCILIDACAVELALMAALANMKGSSYVYFNWKKYDITLWIDVLCACLWNWLKFYNQLEKEIFVFPFLSTTAWKARRSIQRWATR